MKLKPIIKDREAAWKTIVTLISLFLLALVFMGFFALYRFEANKWIPSYEYDFSSVNTEYVLNSFLRTPVPTADTSIKNPIPAIEGVTYADLISWTCSDPKTSSNHRILQGGPLSVNNFFSNLYDPQTSTEKGRKWGFKIIYSNELGVKSWVFGEEGYESKTKNAMKTFGAEGDVAFLEANIRWRGFASQIIPCKEGGFAKVMLFTDTDGINQDKLIKNLPD